MIISVDAEKEFHKIKHPFIITTLFKVDIEGTYLRITKAIYDKPTIGIIFNTGKYNALLCYYMEIMQIVTARKIPGETTCKWNELTSL